MILCSQAPSRLSLFGGGTDIMPYADKHGGLVINMAINLRQKMKMYTDDDTFKYAYKNIFPPRANPDFYYKIFKEFEGVDGGRNTKLECKYDGLLESGLGSSASAAVALVGAINKCNNLGMNLHQIAEKAWDIEVNKIGLYGGKQDQYAAAFGGVNVIEFKKPRVDITPLARGFIEPLLSSLLLFYLGTNRESSTIQEGFKYLSGKQIKALNKIKQLAFDAIEPIGQGDIETVGKLLDESWQMKKKSNKGVDNKLINDVYDKAKKSGAYGGKICGAGGGGFILFCVPPIKRKAFIKDMQKEGLEWWDFTVDWNGLEVRILNQ